MRVPAYVSAVVLAVSVMSSPVLHAQSLGDVAKQEEERRKDVKSTSKVYTNKDLGAPISLATPEDAPKAPAETTTGLAAGDKPKDASKDGAKDEGTAKDQ